MGWEVRARAQIPAPILGMSLGEASPSWRCRGDTHRFPWRAWGTPGAIRSRVTLRKKGQERRIWDGEAESQDVPAGMGTPPG